MRRRAGLVIAVVLVASATASAQDRGDISAGYRFIRSEDVNYSRGWYVDVTGHLTDMVSLVGDVGGSYKSESETFAGVSIEGSVKLHTFAGGLKVRAATMNPSVVPFGQALFGFGNAKAEASGGGISISESLTDPLLNLSGGVDISGALPVGLRVQAGWVRVFSEGEAGNAFHISVGARFGF